MARTRLQAKKEEQAKQQAADSSTSHATAAQHANSYSSGDSVSESDDDDPVRRPRRTRGQARTSPSKRKRSSTSSSSSSSNSGETGNGQEDGSEGLPPPKRRRIVEGDSPSKADGVENDHAVASTQRPRFRNVLEGAGHTYTFDLAKEDRIRWIGTTGCNTCIGSYFSISEEKCFVGHWNYEVRKDDSAEARTTSRGRLLRLATEGFRDASEYLISDYAFDWIRRDVKKKLADWQWSCGWGPVTTRMRASLVLICPHCDSGDAGRRYVGDAVAAGIKEFLCIIDGDLQPVKTQSFIVRHDGSRRPEVRFFETENPGSESQPWQRFNHEDNHRCEQLKVRDDRIPVQELELDDPVALGEPEDNAVAGM